MVRLVVSLRRLPHFRASTNQRARRIAKINTTTARPGSETLATATKMNPQTVIATQMLTPQGRLIATLPPKRRFKLPIERERANDEIGAEEVGKRSCHRWNRSGHPHQEWVTARTALCSGARKLPRAALSHEIIDSFTRASVSSAAAVPFLLRFQMGTLLKRTTATVLILIALTIAANADILPSLVGSPTPFGSSFVFNYAAHLSTNERMDRHLRMVTTPSIYIPRAGFDRETR